MGAVREGHFQLLPGCTKVLLRAIDVIRALMRRDPSILGRTRQRFTASLQELNHLGQAPSVGDVTPTTMPISTEVSPAENVSEAVGVESTRGGEGKTGEGEERKHVSRQRFDSLLNLVGELVINRGRELEQATPHVGPAGFSESVANKSRLIDAVRTFEDERTFLFRRAPVTW